MRPRRSSCFVTSGSPTKPCPYQSDVHAVLATDASKPVSAPRSATFRMTRATSWGSGPTGPARHRTGARTVHVVAANPPDRPRRSRRGSSSTARPSTNRSSTSAVHDVRGHREPPARRPNSGPRHLRRASPVRGRAATARSPDYSSANSADRSVWPFGDFRNAPRLGNEPVRGSGCGADGSIGELVPDGIWAGFVAGPTPTR